MSRKAWISFVMPTRFYQSTQVARGFGLHSSGVTRRLPLAPLSMANFSGAWPPTLKSSGVLEAFLVKFLVVVPDITPYPMCFRLSRWGCGSFWSAKYPVWWFVKSISEHFDRHSVAKAIFLSDSSSTITRKGVQNAPIEDAGSQIV